MDVNRMARSLLASPRFPGDEEKTRIAGVLHPFLLVLLIVFGVLSLLAPVIEDISIRRQVITLPLTLLALVLLVLVHRGRVRFVGAALSAGLWLLSTAAMLIDGGVLAPAFGGYLIVVFVAGVSLGWRGALRFAGLCIVSGVAMLYATQADLLPPRFYNTPTPLWIWAIQTVYLLMATMLMSIARRGTDQALEDARRELAERRRTEAALRASEARFATAFRASPIAISISTLAEGRLVDVNASFLRMFGYRHDEVIGHTVLELELWADPVVRARLLAQLADGQPVFGFESQYRTKSAAIRDGMLSAEQIDLGGDRCVLSLIYDITARKQAEAEMQAANVRLHALSRQLVTAQEDERRRIARELHDEIGQALALVKLNMRVVQRRAGADGLDPRLEQSLGVVEATLLRVRALALDLRPSLLDDLGLIAALRWYVDQQTHLAGLAGEVIAAPDLGRLPAEVETVCFRVTQEALANVIRHAQAERFRVTITLSAGAIELAIADDGVGFDAVAALEHAAQGQSGGLLGMQERVALCGGRLTIESALGRGTTLRAHIPCALPEDHTRTQAITPPADTCDK
ncbi:MAG TPA: PAS domain-containing sensor histidine kinase [Chloroflexaceae bacterium]|nr:PAS domain-containing sensor histidine kinase [Chloroflexaceae bacterium]